MNNSAAGHADWNHRGDDPSAADAAAASAARHDGGFRLDDFKAIFRDAPYYSTGRDWSDYVPAYQYGRDAYQGAPAARYEELEPRLEREWDAYRPPSRLAWVEARGAVEHAWQHAKQGAHLPDADDRQD